VDGCGRAMVVMGKLQGDHFLELRVNVWVFLTCLPRTPSSYSEVELVMTKLSCNKEALTRLIVDLSTIHPDTLLTGPVAIITRVSTL
jgi:hypothetical protein